MSSEPIEPKIGGKIVAAEVAASEKDWHKTEDALLNALSEVRRQKAAGGED